MQRKTLAISLVTVVLVLILGGFLFWFSQKNDVMSPPPTDSEGQTSAETGSTTTPPAGETDVSVTIIPEDRPRGPLPGFENDRDLDNLTDEEEAQYKTNPADSDTDGDGINDDEEIRVWKTDPTKADTDEDGFADAVEIMNGYNPNGNGTLE